MTSVTRKFFKVLSLFLYHFASSSVFLLFSCCFVSILNSFQMYLSSLLTTLLIAGISVQATSRPFFLETFDDGDAWKSRWVVSENTRVDNKGKIHKYEGRWEVAEPSVFFGGKPGDKALITQDPGMLYAISTKFAESLEVELIKPFVLQYELKFQDGLECGGAYLRLMADEPDFDPKTFTIAQPSSLLFGPEHCGYFDRIHFAFRHKHPVTGVYEMKYLINPPKTVIERITSLYSLVVYSNNTFKISVNQNIVREGNLLTDFDPPVNPPSDINDPNDTKPVDWDERAEIPDPNAAKPEDWDESAPAQIPDVSANMPEDWLEMNLFMFLIHTLNNHKIGMKMKMANG